MDIIISSPGSPGTSFTDEVKEQIMLFSDELEKNDDFDSLSEFKRHLISFGLNEKYTRNILAFLQHCGIIKYDKITKFENKKVFTNIGRAYIDILKSIKIAKEQPVSTDRDAILKLLERIQETIYFQCLVIMMKTPECHYATDFFDVLRFVYKYGHIDKTEYMLILYERDQNPADFLENMADIVQRYRDGSESINVKTKTRKSNDGNAKSVNSFPYVKGNFEKSGIFFKEDNKFFIVKERRTEVECAIKEVIVCQNSVK